MAVRILAFFTLMMFVFLSGCTAPPATNNTSNVTNNTSLDNSSINLNMTNVTNSTNQTASPKTVVVNMTSGGFSPNLITINSGDTVEFFNVDSSQHWPASNPHPFHTDYPGFDARAGINKDQSYNFTFNRTGRWGYHDHLNTGFGGTIIVQ